MCQSSTQEHRFQFKRPADAVVFVTIHVRQVAFACVDGQLLHVDLAACKGDGIRLMVLSKTLTSACASHGNIDAVNAVLGMEVLA